MGGNFSFDKNGDFYSTTTIYGYIKKANIKETYITLMALMNSKLLWWFLSKTGTVLANGYFRYKPNYLQHFPVPDIGVEISKQIDLHVYQLMLAKTENDTNNIHHLTNEIDEIIFSLYDLTKDEKALIYNNL